MIVVERVSKYYGENGAVQALDEVDLRVSDGEFAVIVGPSGCGKTTLLKVIECLVEATSGRVLIDGEPVTEPSPKTAMVFQSFQLYPWRTVRENVVLGLEIRGVNKAERRELAGKWIDRVGLTGFEEHYPSELSGGMQQRVGLARALIVNPEIILMDEPFGALDAQTRDRMQTELLQLLADQDATVLFITHDIREAIYLGDRVLVMSEAPGKIIADIPIEFDRPRWENRIEIQSDPRFTEYERQLREELGLTY